MDVKDWVALAEAAPKLVAVVGILIFGVPLLRRYKLKSFEVFGFQFERIESELRHAEADHKKMMGSATWVLSREGLASIRQRASRLAARLRQSHVLWIDDKHPSANIHERRALGLLGANVDTVRTTSEAQTLLAAAPYDVLISNYSRDDDQGAATLLSSPDRPPVILYAGKPRQKPDGAFGYTIRPDELLHLVMDALERTAVAA